MVAEQIPFERFSSESSVVFFTGAGVAAESGVPTFRDTDGLWSKYDPYELASPDGFRKDPELVSEWYEHRRQKALNVEPNPGHFAITDFQKLFPNSVVITQNVDGLHERAGNREILELHGNLHRVKCFKCSQPLNQGEKSCECGGLARPDVVWFGESLNPIHLSKALDHARSAVLFFTIGTSTQVFPAAQMPFAAREAGAFVIEINPHLTPFSAMADLSLQQPSGLALPSLYKEFHEVFAS